MITIFTTCFAGFDDLREQEIQTIDARWIAVVDQEMDAPEPWVLEVVKSRYDHPRMAAKRYKTQPWLITEDSDVVYIDANMRVTSPTFAEDALGSRHHGIATWRHPQRETIQEEARASLELAPKKYADQPIIEQVADYYRQGYPDDRGLYACGTLAYDLDDARVIQFGRRWLRQCELWTYQDQISFPVVCWQLGIRPGTFPHRQIRSTRRLYNPWMRIEPHNFDN